jgi:hypothetical protein
MVNSQVNVATRSRDYSSPQTVPGLESPPPPETPLHIEKPEPPSRITKGVLKHSTHNMNARDTQNYSIVEDLVQTPCAMSALEVLQTCPSWRNALLYALGALDPSGSKVIKFDVTNVKPCLPYHVAFQIHVGYSKYTIKHVVVDEGATTCVMSLICWKSLVSLTLSQYPTMLTAFDGRSFHSHGILHSFPVHLGGKKVEVYVEVVDAPLDYNLLLGRNWTYAMNVFISSVFCTLCFPHDGRIVVIYHLSFAYNSPSASVGPSIPVIDNSQSTTKNIGVRMYSSLMGTFNFMALIHHVYAMSSRPVSLESSIPFRTSYFNDPWNLPSLTASCEGQSHDGMTMPLSAVEIAYQDVFDSSTDPDPITSQMDEEDPVLKLVWATSSSYSHEYLDDNFPLDEVIIEAMNGSNKPWDDMHHRSYLSQSLLESNKMNFDIL